MELIGLVYLRRHNKMTLQNTGSISFTNISNEFGNQGSIGAYRSTQSIGGRNWPLDEGIPTSGAISFSDFYGRRRNIIIDCYTSGGKRVSAGDRARTTVGGGPTNVTGSRLIIYVNNTFKGDKAGNSRTRYSLRTGGFANAAKMDIILGNSARILGAGGNGGAGGTRNENGANSGKSGQPGQSALALDRNVEEIVLSSGAIIRAGSGGGGGGGGAAGEKENSKEQAGGGGGGGGSGTPAGNAGAKAGEGSAAGNAGNSTKGGNGGRGGEAGGNAFGGGGGGGGSWGAGNGGEGGAGGENSENQAENGFDGNTSGTGGKGGKGRARGTGQEEESGGSGGASGYSITSVSGVVIPTPSGGTVQGPRKNGGGVS